jgi:3-phenylpropionate/cinnamic acid dioxygenase small subunit
MHPSSIGRSTASVADKAPTSDAIRELVGQAALALDAEAFDDFLAFCTDDFHYRIRVMSPELGREMIWLEQTRTELEKLFEALPEHLTRPGRLTRQVTVATIQSQPPNWQVTSTFSVFHTDFEGRTEILAVGRYQDQVTSDAGTMRLSERDVYLDTRDLGIGSHVPF